MNRTGRPTARRRIGIAGLALLGLLAATGCAAVVPGGNVAADPDAGPMITVTPQDGTGAVRADARVTVTVQQAVLAHVDVTDPQGAYLAGTYDVDHASWRASTPLAPGRDYAVAVVATDDAGRSSSRHYGFHTADRTESDRLLIAEVTPGDGAEVGVAYPLTVTLNHPVANRRAVTDALEVETFPRVEGAWYWIDERTLDYRPESFWPAGTSVTLHADLEGVDAGNGLWGAANRTSDFTVGRAQVMDVDVQSHAMKVIQDGAVIATFPVSSGKPGWETRNGIKVITEKIIDKTWYSSAINAPEHYVEHSQWAMRMTDSGEFIHDAPWNAKHLGEDNASHGCVGLSTDDMNWVWAHSMLGDPVVVTGSPVPYTELDNRIQDWNVAWDRWLTGNFDLTD
jgi:lipoprotein-anchoring transpeptidase ErfK/SrfK